MSFLDQIFATLDKQTRDGAVSMVNAQGVQHTTGHELLVRIQDARRYLRQAGVSDGRRCALIAPNTRDWVAMDLAIIAEGGIVVPLYERMSPQDQIAIMKDCEPVLVVCGDRETQQAIKEHWPGAPPSCVLSEAFHEDQKAENWQDPPKLADDRVVAIIYTSGTSGAAKGVMLNSGNLNFMLERTVARFDQLLSDVHERQRFFHYLPFCFAGSWFLLLSSLIRGNALYLSTDLQNIRDELKSARPHFFMNVPTFLERIKRGVEGAIAERGGLARKTLDRAKTAWARRVQGRQTLADRWWLGCADRIIFRTVRDGISKDLQAIVCGSAPLAEETQHFFNMMGVQVLQVYGLTETTAICTMDLEDDIRPGWVGHPIEGVELRLGEQDEVQVRGANIFPGYWNRSDETASAFDGDWFRTGDQGQVDQHGNWKIVGRIKDIIILNSGHNIAPEPLEAKLLDAIPGATQVVLVGDDRSFLSMIVAGEVEHDAVSTALDGYNETQTQYKRVHAFHICTESLTAIEGLLTANGKLRRTAISEHFRTQIEEMNTKRAS